jgi:ornithine cyclodeaminase
VDATTLLMVGTGALAPHLVRAHLAVRALERVLIWGRSKEKAAVLARSLADLPLDVHAVEDLAEAVALADIISCATLSRTPLICGEKVRPGTHVDLVGSFTADMREGDDALMSAAQIFVDTRQAFSESGDLIAPVTAGLIEEADVLDLGALLAQPSKGRSSDSAITVFKSVGTALSDLAAAEYFVNRYERQQAQRS